MASHRITALPVALLVLAAPMLGADRTVKFNRDVRPILSDKCFGCHGPDSVAKKIPLRLDSEGAASAVVAGGAQAKLIQRITADDKALSHAPRLFRAELDRPRRSRRCACGSMQGAKWEKHWSFIAPERPPLPKVKNTAWPRNPIDYFHSGRGWNAKDSRPRPKPRGKTLIRRVSLDLTGLPPTPAEVDAFVQDKSPNAYEKVVDRLLASPRYGERMAARWLDAARYADSNGYQFDGERVMWRWRDWVIAAFNRNHAVRPVHARTDRRRHAARTPRSRRRSPPDSTATIARTPRMASFPRSTRWSMWWTAWKPPPPCSSA